jgi:hypothetical protein
MSLITNIIVIISLLVGILGLISPIVIFKQKNLNEPGKISMLVSSLCIWLGISGLFLSLCISEKMDIKILIFGSLIFGILILIGNALSLLIKRQIDILNNKRNKQ